MTRSTTSAPTIPIGFIMPADSRLDWEVHNLVRTPAAPYVTRTRMPSYGTSEAMTAASLRALAESPDLEDAADRLRGLRPAAVAYVDTSITFVRGPGGDVDINERIARFAGCPATCTGTAVLDALVALGLKNVAVVTPYPKDVNDWIPPFLATRDIAVEATAIMSTNYGAGADSGVLSQIGVDVLESAIRTVDSESVDGIFISCTAVRTVDYIDHLEQTFGKPVVTSIQATVWRTLQLAGLNDVREGAGTLFSGGSAAPRLETGRTAQGGWATPMRSSVR